MIYLKTYEKFGIPDGVRILSEFIFNKIKNNEVSKMEIPNRDIPETGDNIKKIIIQNVNSIKAKNGMSMLAAFHTSKSVYDKELGHTLYFYFGNSATENDVYHEVLHAFRFMKDKDSKVKTFKSDYHLYNAFSAMNKKNKKIEEFITLLYYSQREEIYAHISGISGMLEAYRNRNTKASKKDNDAIGDFYSTGIHLSMIYQNILTRMKLTTSYTSLWLIRRRRDGQRENYQ